MDIFRPILIGAILSQCFVDLWANDATFTHDLNGNQSGQQVSMQAPPVIVSQPKDALLQPGGTVRFTVVAQGPGALTYQWRHNGTDIPAATSDVLVITGLAINLPSYGQYTVVVSNGPGSSVTSAPATVIPDSDADGLRDSWEIQQFGSLVQGARGDPDGDGISAFDEWINSTDPSKYNHYLTRADEWFYQNLNATSTWNIAAYGEFELPLFAAGDVLSFAASGLPPGLNINTSTGLISGNTTAIGVYLVSLSANTANGPATGSLTINVQEVHGWGSIDHTKVPAELGISEAIAAGNGHSLALKADGTVVAFGSNAYGKSSVPVGLTGVTAISAGYDHSLALKADGTVVAWGFDGYNFMSVPSDLSNVMAIEAGDYHSLALKTDGTVVAWGRNGYGQTSVPAGLTGVVAISAGAYFSLALKADGTVIAWGNNYYGQTTVPAGLTGVVAIAAGGYYSLALKADGTVVGWGSTTVPTGLTGVVAIAAGGLHSLALKADGTVVGWGDNSYGQTTVPPSLSNVVAISAGFDHSLALKADGTVVGWGNNIYGQTTVFPPLTGVVAIAAGSDHNLALKTDGTVVGWGFNDQGETTVPEGLTGVVAIAAGSDHSLALKADGTVVAWGSNSSGQSKVPAGLTGVVAIAAGGSHSLALKADGTVVGWGSTSYGQRTVPTGLSNVVAIAAGRDHSLALKADGTVFGWGSNGKGQTSVPTGLAGVVAIAAGYSHSLALKADGTVVGWGSNNFGQTSVPGGLTGVAAIAAGGNEYYLDSAGSHSLALKADGTVVSWGSNGRGQTTNPTGSTGVVTIAAGGSHNLALLGLFADAVPKLPVQRFAIGLQGLPFWLRVPVKGGVVTFSAANLPPGLSIDPAEGLITGTPLQAGVFNVIVSATNGSGIGQANLTITINTPVPEITSPRALSTSIGSDVNFQTTIFGTADSFAATGLPPGLSIHPLTGLISGTLMATGVYQVVLYANTVHGLATGTLTITVPDLLGWGDNNSDQLTIPAGLTGVVAIAAGGFHSLALKTDEKVVGWGSNSSNQAKVYLTQYSFLSIAAGYSHSLALKADGTVVGWGSNGNAQSRIPTGLTGVVAIAAGGGHSLALKTDGTVVGWSYNGYGQTTIPAGLTGVVAIAAGGNHSLALKADGTVAGWGLNNYGQTTIPVDLPGVVVIAAGDSHSLALKADGTVVGWGLNSSGQATVPAGLTGVVAIAAGGNHSLALKADGTVVGWGSNSSGQRTVPAGLSGVVAIAAGGSHSLALKADGTVVGWGSNSSGQTTVPADLTGVVDIAVGGPATATSWYGSHMLSLKADGKVVAWGNNSDGQTTVPADLSGVVAIAAGVYHSLALKADGKVVAWGKNSQLQAAVPSGLSNVVAIAAGYLHSLALKADGTIVGWGSTTVPTGLTGVVAIAAGSHSLALKADGTVVAWGYNTYGEATVPTGLTGVVAIAAGAYHSLALKADGTVVGWGLNSSGQATVPAGLTGVVAIDAGFNHSLALKADGTVVAWGSNSSGQATVPAGLASVAAIAAGGDHSLVLLGRFAETVPMLLAPRFAVGVQGLPFRLRVPAKGEPATYAAANLPAGLSINQANGLIMGIPIQSGVFNVTLSATNGSGTSQSPLTLTILPGATCYETWIGRFVSGSEAEPGVDLDGDGMTNLLEYVLGDDPMLSARTKAPVGTLEPLDFVFRYRRAHGTEADTEQVVQWSSDMLAWNDIQVGSASGGAVMVQDLGLEELITATIPRSYAANGRLFARLKIGLPGPEIAVEQLAGSDLIDGSATISCGSAGVGSPAAPIQFTIHNTGNTNLKGINVSKSGPHLGDITVNTTGMASTLPPGASTTFTVTFTPSAAGIRTAALQIASNDTDENSFDIALTGIGVLGSEIALSGNGTNIPNGDASPSPAVHTDFGSATVTGGTVVRTFTISNSGSEALNLTGNPRVALTGSSAFSVTTQPASGAVATGGSATFAITFDPSAAGTTIGTVIIANNDSDENSFMFSLIGTGTAQEMALSGNGVNIPNGDTTPRAADHTDFGSATVTGGTVVRTFTISNSGSETLNLTGNPQVALSGSNAFSVTTQPASGTVAAGGSVTFAITFDPSAAGTANAMVSVANNDSDENPFIFAITGTGTVPEIALSGNGANIPNGDSTPSAADHTDFGSTAVTGGTVVRTFTINNSGSAALNLTGNPQVALSGSSAFSVTTQPASGAVATGGSATFAITFDPSAAGTANAMVSVANNDSDENPFTFTITGTGTAPEIALSGNGANIPNFATTLSTANHTLFGNTAVTGGTVVRTFTISNSGSEALNLTGNPRVALSGSSAFSVTTQPASGTVAAGGSVTFAITFDPTTTGLVTATVSIANNDSDENPFYFPIGGTGTAPEIDLRGNGANIPNGDTTPSVSDHTDFGNTAVTGGTVARTFTISNSGNETLNLTGNPRVALSGSSAFSVTTQPTSGTVAAGGSVTFAITFDPSAAGTTNATVSIANNDSDENPFTFAITGAGVGSPEIAVEQPAGTNLTDGAATITCGAANVGSSSVPLTVKISNTGNADLTGLVVSKSGTNAGDFAIAQPANTMLAPGASTTFTVTFTPSAAGTRNASIQIASNDADENPFDIALTGSTSTLTDTDNDGLLDGVETNTGTYVDSSNTGTSPLLPDTDGDGAGDWYEVIASSTNPTINTSKPNIPYPLPDPIASDAGVSNKPVKVYIMSGSTNMAGRGYVNGTALGTLETIAKRENKFPNLVTAGNTWTTRNDVIYKGVISATVTGPLTAGQGGNSTSLGPELGFGHVMGYHHDEPVLLIKASAGNRSLNFDILPPGSPSYNHTDGYTYAGYGQAPNKWLTAGGGPSPFGWYAGIQYDNFFLAESDMGCATVWATSTSYAAGIYIRHNGVTYTCKTAHTSSAASEPGIGTQTTTYWNVYSVFNVTDVLDNFAIQYPDWATQGFEIAGYVWWQGYNDIIDGSPYTDRYETNMAQLITQLRTYYANRYPGKCSTTTPFVLATGCGDPQTSGNGLIVANAQLAMNNAFAGNVKTIDNRNYWRSSSESPSTDPSSYYNNAETYMLTGDALGRAMIELQQPSSTPGSFSNEQTENSGSAGFASWVAAAGLKGHQTAASAAPNGDGIANLLKYAFNMNGDAPDVRQLKEGIGTSGLPAIRAAGNVLRVEFVRRIGAGLSYSPMKSTSLAGESWSDFGDVPTVTPISDGWERVVYEEPILPGTPRLFAKIEVTLTE